jgi:hypothetical protein
MLTISDPEQRHNWERFETAVSLRSKRDPKTDLLIIGMARLGISRKQIKKDVVCTSEYVDTVCNRAIRRGLL